MKQILLDVQNLSFYLKLEKSKVYLGSNITFNLKEREVFGLVGESGCGKTLTALSVVRILPQNIYPEGKIIFKDKELLSLSEEQIRHFRGRHISMIFQEPMTSLNPVMTIGMQIAEPLMTHLGLSKKDALSRAQELLEAVQIPSSKERLKNYPHQLSGGMRQRVMIAMAIACNPSLLIADEPTTALDVTIQAEILNLLQHLRLTNNMSVLFITHDLSLISEQADRVAVMYAGRIIELAETEDLFNNPQHPYTKGLLASLPSKKGIKLTPIQGIVPPIAAVPKGCKFFDRCSDKSKNCEEIEPDLLEIYNNHYVRCMRCFQKSY
ncbi:MAG: ABC transporter ATP-binding protein [Thermodesulfovibrionales bacterium]|nr:ABC transporter ATP-binding protein [Thermodesulfovibrionales bacterium]